MAPSITKTQRWLDLIAYLVGRRLPVTLEEIMEHVRPVLGRRSGGDSCARMLTRAVAPAAAAD